MLMVFQAWNNFFHQRLGSEGCRFAGWLRIAYAFLFVADRLLLTLDLETLLSPTVGLVPLKLGRTQVEANRYSIFQLAPESDLLLWTVHIVGIIQGILLLLGVAPRFQMLGVFVNLLSFAHHNQVIWDYEDQMFQDFCFVFLFMPLHRRTIFDNFGLKGDDKPDDSFPMWPIRLFQLEVCFVYLGSVVAKLAGPSWFQGTGLFYISYSTDFFPGLYSPDFLFKRMGPLKVMSWSALFLEMTCFFVWIPIFRKPIVWMMVIFHLGIEVMMNMHCFEWLAIVGWLTFLLEPEKKKKPIRVSPPKEVTTNLFIFFFLLLAVVCQVPSYDNIWDEEISVLEKFNAWQISAIAVLAPIINPIGAYLSEYHMYSGENGWTMTTFAAEIIDRDGLRREWYSPDWPEMSYLERKRNVRLMNYYETLSYDDMERFQRLFLRRFVQKEEEEVGPRRITLYAIMASAPDHPQEIGFWEPLDLPPSITATKLMTLLVPECGVGIEPGCDYEFRDPGHEEEIEHEMDNEQVEKETHGSHNGIEDEL